MGSPTRRHHQHPRSLSISKTTEPSCPSCKISSAEPKRSSTKNSEAATWTRSSAPSRKPPSEEKIRSGLGPQEAQRAARIEMGSIETVKHKVRAATWESTAEGIWQDVRYSFRSLAKSPELHRRRHPLTRPRHRRQHRHLHPHPPKPHAQILPVTDPQQLVTFGKFGGRRRPRRYRPLATTTCSPGDFARQLEATPGSIPGHSRLQPASLRKSACARPPPPQTPPPRTAAVIVPASLVSGNYFSVLGAQPLLGRSISSSRRRHPGSGCGRRSSATTSGSSPLRRPRRPRQDAITINGTPFTVIGVMPERFHGIKLNLNPRPVAPRLHATVVHPATHLPHAAVRPLLSASHWPTKPEAASNKTALAQSQNWLDQQIRAGITATEGAAHHPARQQEINRATVPLVSATSGVSSLRNQYGDSLKILMASSYWSFSSPAPTSPTSSSPAPPPGNASSPPASPSAPAAPASSAKASSKPSSSPSPAASSDSASPSLPPAPSSPSSARATPTSP